MYTFLKLQTEHWDCTLGCEPHLEVLWGAGSIEQGPPDSSEVVGCDGGHRPLLTEVLVQLRLQQGIQGGGAKRVRPITLASRAAPPAASFLCLPSHLFLLWSLP